MEHVLVLINANVNRVGQVGIVPFQFVRKNAYITEIAPTLTHAHARKDGLMTTVQNHCVHKTAIMTVFVLPQIPANACSGKIHGEMEGWAVASLCSKTQKETRR